jgi:hypothetical protein
MEDSFVFVVVVLRSVYRFLAKGGKGYELVFADVSSPLCPSKPVRMLY